MIEKLSGFFLSKWFSWDITLLLECILYFAKTFCKVRNESDEDGFWSEVEETPHGFRW